MAAADVCAEGLDSEIPTIKHVIEVEPPKCVSKSRNTEVVGATSSGETKILQSG